METLLTYDEARALTTRINETAGNLCDLLLEAYERRAWDAMGYESWRKYATEELKVSQPEAYRQLNFAKVRAAIALFSPIGEKPANEAQARPLTRLDTPEERVEAWQEAVETAPGGKVTAKPCCVDPAPCALRATQANVWATSSNRDSVTIAGFTSQTSLEDHIPPCPTFRYTTTTARPLHSFRPTLGMRPGETTLSERMDRDGRRKKRTRDGFAPPPRPG